MISELRAEVAQREHDLADAKQRLAIAEHDEAMANLKAIRADVKTTKEKVHDLKHKLDLAAVAVVHIQRKIEAVEIPADPDPFEEDQWAEERRAALEKVQQLRAQLLDAVTKRDQLQVEVVRVNKAYESLLYSERNALAKAKGDEVAPGWKGSVTRV